MTGPENGNGLAGMSTDELRAAVRAVLHDVLPAAVVDPVRAAAVTDQPTPLGEHVALRTDADLDVFVRRLAVLCADPVRRVAFQEGRHGFRLSTGDAASTASAPTAAVVRVERGAVTERTVSRAAAEGARLVLGKGAVLTPLARDKARSLGVAVDKES